MKKSIKVLIKKPKQTRGDWAFYREVGRVLLTESGPIQTEGQFAAYLYKNFGEGRVQCIAWQKGHEGFWLFWLGNLYPNGFHRDISKNKEVEKLKKDFVKAQSYDEKQDIEEEISFEKEISSDEKKYKRRGPHGLKRARPGQLNNYEEY